MGARPHKKREPVRRFLQTPKGVLIVVLVVLTALAAAEEGPGVVAPGLAGAVAVAVLLDAAILRKKRGAWEFPSGALLSGLIVAAVLAPREPWYVAAFASAMAVASKYAFRTRVANVFNPAAIALVAAFYLFGTGHSWWGAQAGATPLALVALIGTGIFVTGRVNRAPLVIAFLGGYYLLFTATAFLGDARQVAEIFRPPDLQAVLYFAFFILTDPPTSPAKHRHQMACGVIVAAASYAIFELVGASYYLLAGVLVGNVWEAWRRTRRLTTFRDGRRPATGHPARRVATYST